MENKRTEGTSERMEGKRQKPGSIDERNETTVWAEKKES